MRIAVNTRFLLPGRLEGLGWYTHELVRRMVLQHPDDTFYFLFDRPYDSSFLYAGNVKPLVVFPPARHPVLWYLWFEWALPRVLKRVKAEVFFSPDSYLSLSTDVPTVMTVHDLIPLQFPEQVPWWSRDYFRYFIPRYLRRADRLIAISGYVRQTVQAIPGTSPEKITVVYNGSREGFLPLPETERQAVREKYTSGAVYFLYTGAIHPRKNIPRLIRAFDRFKAHTGHPAKLLLAGRFAWETGLVKAAWEETRYRADVQFLGYVPETELHRLTAGALALVNVSLIEGFGLPLLEAMHAETAILCSNTTALPEVAGEAALLVDPSSEEAIAGGLARLALEEALRTRLIEASRHQRERFDWDQAARQLYEILRAAASQH